MEKNCQKKAIFFFFFFVISILFHFGHFYLVFLNMQGGGHEPFVILVLNSTRQLTPLGVAPINNLLGATCECHYSSFFSLPFRFPHFGTYFHWSNSPIKIMDKQHAHRGGSKEQRGSSFVVEVNVKIVLDSHFKVIHWVWIFHIWDLKILAMFNYALDYLLFIFFYIF